MRRALRIAALLVAVATQFAPAHAKDDFVWEGYGCHETVAVHPAPAVDPDGVLVLLAYQCDKVEIGENVHADVAVSEISVMDACDPGGACPRARARLLRQVADNGALVAGLRSLGVTATSLGQIEYDNNELATSTTVRVQGATYSFDGLGAAPDQPKDKEGKGQEGASYTYDGHKGSTKISYTNYSQTAREAIVEVNTTDDPQLARWLGSAPTTTAGLVTRGHWTGTARMETP